MPRSNDTLIRIAGISVPMLLVAFAAHTALKPPKDVPTVSAGIPTAEELDSLARYLIPRQSRGVPVVAVATPVQYDQPDPFISMEYVAPPETPLAPDTVARPVPRDRYVVSAILISNDKRIAVINEQLVTVGSMLPGGFRVTAIENNHVQIVAPTGVSRMLSIRESTTP